MESTKSILYFAVIGSFCFLSNISNAQTPDWLWAKSAGGTDDDEAVSVAVDASGNTYLAGYFFSPNITFGSTTLMNAGWDDMFLAKLESSSTGIYESNDQLTISVFPNPSNGKFTITFPSATIQIQILNSLGKIMQTKYVDNGEIEQFELPENGIYLIKIKTDKALLTKKLIICK